MLMSLSGCLVRGPWKETDSIAQAPWVAPGVRGRYETRHVELLGAPAETWESRWIGRRSQRLDPISLHVSLTRPLQNAGMYQQWPATTGSINSVPQRMAPFRFFLVSLFPTVVLMIPWEYGTLQGRSNNDILKDISSAQVSMDGLVNGAELTTVIPYSPHVMWYSPPKGPAPVQLKDPDLGQISLPDGVIELRRDGDQWEVVRIR